MTVILTCCNSPLENDSALIINILELFKQAVFINANKNGNENDDYREFDTHISCKSTLFEQVFEQRTVVGLVKEKFLPNFVKFDFWMIQKQLSKLEKFHGILG